MRDTAGSPERARWLHLARSGSQSQRTIWFVLPARGASHIINVDIALGRNDGQFLDVFFQTEGVLILLLENDIVIYMYRYLCHHFVYFMLAIILVVSVKFRRIR